VKEEKKMKKKWYNRVFRGGEDGRLNAWNSVVPRMGDIKHVVRDWAKKFRPKVYRI